MKKRRLWIVPAILLAVMILTVFAVLKLQILQDNRNNSDAYVQSLLDGVEETLSERSVQLAADAQEHCDAVQTRLAMIADGLRGAVSDTGFALTPAQEELLCCIDCEEEMQICVIDPEGTIIADAYADAPGTGSDNLFDRISMSEDARDALLRGTRGESGHGGISCDITADWISYTIAGESFELYNYLYSEVLADDRGEDSGYRLIQREYRYAAVSDYSLTSMDFIDGLDPDITFLCVQDGFIVNSGKYLYYLPEEVGLTEAQIADGYIGEAVFDGAQCRCIARQMEAPDGTCSIIALWDPNLTDGVAAVVWCAIWFCTALIAFACAGIFFLRETAPEAASEGRRRHILNPAMLKKLAPCMLITLLIVALGTNYLLRMSGVSDTMRDLTNSRTEIYAAFEKSTVYSDSINDYYGSDAAHHARVMAARIACDPCELLAGRTVTPYYEASDDGHNVAMTDAEGNAEFCIRGCEGLDDLLFYMRLSAATIYNLDGLAIATTETNIPAAIDETSAFYPVLLRRADVVTEAINDTYVGTAVPMTLYTDAAEDGSRIYISRDDYLTRSAEGSRTVRETAAMLLVSQAAVLAVEADDDEYIATLLGDENLSYQHMLFAGDDAHTAIYIPDTFGGDSVEELNLPEEIFEGAKYCFVKLNGARYLLFAEQETSELSSETYWLMSLARLDEVYDGILSRTAAVTACALIDLIILSLLLAFMANRADTAPRMQAVGDKKPMSAAKKTWILLRAIAIAYLIAVLVLVMTRWRDESRISIMNWILRFDWKREINLFSVTTAGLLAVAVIAFNYVQEHIAASLSQVVGDRMYACVRLASSILRYASVLFCVFYGLYLFGLNTMSVLTSLGVFSMIVGLGANKLIGDIIAGIFLIFEGDLRAGDIVTVGTFCGKVTEIGIRTTKLENLDGNVNIVTNSTINNVLNMTRKRSRVKIVLKIANSVPVTQVETAIAEALSGIIAACPVTHEAIAYIGIDGIEKDAILFRFEAMCPETQRNAMYRYLNRELALLCARNGFALK